MYHNETEGLKPIPTFLQGQSAGAKAEDAPILQRIGARALVLEDSKTAFIFPTELKIDTANLAQIDENQDFRTGYIEGLQEFVVAHKVDMTWIPTDATPEALALDDVLVGYLRGLRRESPNRGRDVSQQKTKEKPFEKFLKIESKEPTEWQEIEVADEKARREQAGYKLGFLVGVTRDFNVKTGSLEIPSDNPSYKAFMQGLRGETMPMPLSLDLKRYMDPYFKKDLQQSSYGLGGIWVYDVLDDKAYIAGQRLWLASEGLSPFYAHFIRQPGALLAFKAGLEGQIWPPYLRQPVVNIDAFLSQTRTDRQRENNSIYISEKIKSKIENNESTRNEFIDERFQAPDPDEAAGRVEELAYEMGITARIGRKKPQKSS